MAASLTFPGASPIGTFRGLVFTLHAATANICMDLGDMKTQADIDRLLAAGVSLIGLQEFMARDAENFFSDSWQVVQYDMPHEAGRSPIAFDADIYSLVAQDLLVLNGEPFPRYATAARLKHKPSGREFWMVNLQTVAHVDAGGHPGWTDGHQKGFLKRLRAHGKPNPLVADHRASMHTLAAHLRGFNKHGLPVIVTGDFNVDAKADERRRFKDFPYRVLSHVGYTSQYMRHGFYSHGTDGDRFIDYVWVNRRGHIVTSHALPYGYSDHRPVIATLRLA